MKDEPTIDDLVKACVSIDQPESIDLAIVLGCTEPGHDPDFALRNRVLRCIELFERGFFRRVLLTGGAPVDVDRNQRRSEAERMRELLVAHTHFDAEILLECEARNTRDNAARCLALLSSPESRLLTSITSIMVITCDYHTRRARHEFELAFPSHRVLCCGFVNEPAYLLEKCRREWIRLQRLGLAGDK